MFGLRWSDIDLNAGTPHVQRAIRQTPGGILHVELCKTPQSDAVLPLPSHVGEAQGGAFSIYEGLRARPKGDKWNPEGYVLMTRFGTPLKPAGLKCMGILRAPEQTLARDLSRASSLVRYSPLQRGRRPRDRPDSCPPREAVHDRGPVPAEDGRRQARGDPQVGRAHGRCEAGCRARFAADSRCPEERVTHSGVNSLHSAPVRP